MAGTLLVAGWLVRGAHWRLFWAGVLNSVLWIGLYHYVGISRCSALS
ncbi:MAG: hypothetical protein R3E95_19265 [Thiolinea sp.]